MGVPIRATVGPLASAADNNICASQTPGGGVRVMTINGSAAAGGVATLDVARRVLLTFAGDETGHTFTLSGIGQTGLPLTETIAGTTPGTVASKLDYLKVTSIRLSADAAGAIKVGTNTVASSRYINLNDFGQGPVALQVDVSGTVNYTVATTLDDLLALGQAGTLGTATWIDDSNLAAKTGALQDQLPAKPAWARITLNSGSGSATLNVIQAGLAGS